MDKVYLQKTGSMKRVFSGSTVNSSFAQTKKKER